MGYKHEDMDAAKMVVDSNSTSNITAFSGTSASRIHHANIYNTSTTLTASVHLKVHEGTIDQDMVLRHVTLGPEQHTTWAGGLGDDDVFIIQATNNDGSESMTLDITWW